MKNNRKVYFDYNIYGHILDDGNNPKKIINKFIKYHYFYYSGAIAEEVYNRKCNDNGKHEEDIKKSIEIIKYITKNHILRPTTSEGIKAIREQFDECYKRVAEIDTRKYVGEVGKYKLSKEKEFIKMYLVDDKKLQHISAMTHEEIWKLDILRKVIDELNLYIKNIIDEENRIRDFNSRISEDIVLKSGLYDKIKNNYFNLEFVIEILVNNLELIGFKRNTNERVSISGIHDTSHIIYSTYCDLFITDDNKLREKANAIYFYLGIPTKAISFAEFLKDYSK